MHSADNGVKASSCYAGSHKKQEKEENAQCGGGRSRKGLL